MAPAITVELFKTTMLDKVKDGRCPFPPSTS